MLYSDEYSPDAFAFLPEFQVRLLALLVRDSKWLLGHRRAVDHRYWEQEVHRSLAQLILDHFDRYKRPPDLVELASSLEDHLSRTASAEVLRDQFVDVLEYLYEGDIGGPDVLSDKFLVFAKHQAVKASVVKSISLLPERKYDEMEQLMQEAVAIDLDESKCGESYRETQEASLRDKQAALRRPIPTGEARIDKELDGGIGRAEVGAVMAPTGRGKTILLVDFAVGALLAGYRVFYAGLEDPIWKLRARMNRRLLGLTREQLEANPDAAVEKAKKIMALVKGDIEIEWFKPRVTKWEEIISAVERSEQRRGRAYDLLVVDYLNKVAAPRADMKDYQASQALSELAAGWVGEQNKAMWTAIQVTGAGVREKTIDVDHSAGGQYQTHALRIVLTLSQTPAEEETKPYPICRIFFGKSTDGPSRRALRYYIDRARGILIPAEDAPEKKPEAPKAAAAPVGGKK